MFCVYIHWGDCPAVLFLVSVFGIFFNVKFASTVGCKLESFPSFSMIWNRRINTFQIVFLLVVAAETAVLRRILSPCHV